LLPIIEDKNEYLDMLLKAPRPGMDQTLAFYDHRVGVIGKDPKLMLLPLDDHLVHRGDGVFETVKFVSRKLYQLDAHLERLVFSAQSVFLKPPCPWQDLKAMVVEVARAAGQNQGMIRVLLGRGPGGFGIDPGECPESSLYIVA